MSNQEDAFLASKGAKWIQYGAHEPQLTPEEFLEEPNSNLYVPIQLWGKDHWSTFAFIEDADRELDGRVKPQHMRCHSRVHRGFSTNRGPTGDDYPTRLKENVELDQHDDWSCLEDMSAEGLVAVFFQHRLGGRSGSEWSNTSEMKCRAFLTEKGSALADQLLSYKRSGGNYHGFEPDLEKLRGLSINVPERAQEYKSE